MVEYAKVVFRSRDAEVSIWVSHPKGDSQENVIEKAKEGLEEYNVHAVKSGDWVVTVE